VTQYWSRRAFCGDFDAGAAAGAAGVGDWAPAVDTLAAETYQAVSISRMKANNRQYLDARII
jgi:hypothetical protein